MRTPFVPALLLAALLLSGCAAPSAVEDQAQLTAVRKRLEVVKTELDELPALPGAQAAGDAQLTGTCRTDFHDEVAAPMVRRSWTVAGAPATAADRLAKALRERRWRERAPGNPAARYYARADAAGTVHLTVMYHSEGADHRLHLVGQVEGVDGCRYPRHS